MWLNLISQECAFRTKTSTNYSFPLKPDWNWAHHLANCQQFQRLIQYTSVRFKLSHTTLIRGEIKMTMTSSFQIGKPMFDDFRFLILHKVLRTDLLGMQIKCCLDSVTAKWEIIKIKWCLQNPLFRCSVRFGEPLRCAHFFLYSWAQNALASRFIFSNYDLSKTNHTYAANLRVLSIKCFAFIKHPKLLCLILLLFPLLETKKNNLRPPWLPIWTLRRKTQSQKFFPSETNPQVEEHTLETTLETLP